MDAADGNHFPAYAELRSLIDVLSFRHTYSMDDFDKALELLNRVTQEFYKSGLIDGQRAAVGLGRE